MTDLQTTPFTSLHTSLYKEQKDSPHTIDCLYKNKNMKNDSKINETDDDKQKSALFCNDRVYNNLHDCKKNVSNNSSNTEAKHITDKPYTEHKNQVKILSSGTKLETVSMNPKEVIKNNMILDHECKTNKDIYKNLSKKDIIEKESKNNLNYVIAYSENDSEINRDHGKEEFENNNNTSTKHVISEDSTSETGTQEPAHHARRPMNAFLIFCKRHRGVVRARYPSLENRAVTKILGEWWAGLDQDEKASYTALAKQYKDAFFSANPDFKWYKLPAPPLRTLSTRPSNSTVRTSPLPSSTCSSPETPLTSTSTGSSVFTPGKLADETQLGNLNSLINPNYHVPVNDILNESVSKNNLSGTNNNDYSLLELNDRFTKNHDSASLFYRSETTESSPVSEKAFLQISSGSVESNAAPKPPKKRFVNDIKKLETGKSSVSRSIFTMSANDKNNEKESQYSPRDMDYKLFSNEQNPFFNLRNYAYSSTLSIEDNKLKRVSKITNIKFNKEKMESNLCYTSEQDTNQSTNSIDDILNYDSKNIAENMTQQELIDRVVDRSMCSDLESHNISLQLSSDSEINVINQQCDSIERRTMHTNKMDVRKSVRSCKGKRYAEFMIEGRLIVNKRVRKNSMPTIHTTGSKKMKHKDKQDDNSEHAFNNESNISFIGLSDTIQKLTDRTKNYNDIFESDAGSSNGEMNFITEPRKRTLSEASDDSITKKMFRAEDFDLNAKIEALPSLSLDKFQQKKKENKKKKKIVHTSKHVSEPIMNLRKEPDLRHIDIISSRDNNGDINEEANNNVEVLIGSRKRKARKQSITHIDPQMIATVKTSVAQPELFNLATLAEVALKMNDKFTSL